MKELIESLLNTKFKAVGHGGVSAIQIIKILLQFIFILKINFHLNVFCFVLFILLRKLKNVNLLIAQALLYLRLNI